MALRKVATGGLWVLIGAVVLFWILMLVADWSVALKNVFLVVFTVLGLRGLIQIVRRRGLVAPELSTASTVELPATSATRGAITAVIRKEWRQMAVAMVVVMGLMLLLGVVLSIAEPSGFSALLILVLVGLGVDLLLGIIGWIVELPKHQDLREPTYLRTTGPIQVEKISASKGFLLRLADRAFVVPRDVGAKIPNRSSATVDYSRRGHVVFVVYDEAGHPIFHHPDYHPELSAEAERTGDGTVGRIDVGA